MSRNAAPCASIWEIVREISSSVPSTLSEASLRCGRHGTEEAIQANLVVQRMAILARRPLSATLSSERRYRGRLFSPRFRRNGTEGEISCRRSTLPLQHFSPRSTLPLRPVKASLQPQVRRHVEHGLAVALHAEAHDGLEARRANVGHLAELLALLHVGDVDLDHGQPHRLGGVENGD